MAYVPARRRSESLKAWAAGAARYLRPDPRTITDLDAARAVVTNILGGPEQLGPKSFEAVSAALLALHRNPPSAAPLHSWKPERRASRECIRHFVRKAVERKAWLASLDAAWFRQASDMSKEMARETFAYSVHRLAREMLEYKRMRAFLCVGKADAGSYAPTGWPIDRPAREAWLALNPQAMKKAA